MRPKSMILIVVALGCGLIASIGISQVMENREVSSPIPILKETIYVAVRDVPLGQVMNAQMVKMEDWPQDSIPEGAIKRLEDIEGKRPLTRLYPGEPILSAKLVDANKFLGASDKIPMGMRVVSVKVTVDSSASGLLNPGDRVDVLVYLRRGKGILFTTTRTIMKNVTVFAVNAVTQREVDDTGAVIQAKTVSLLVTPSQVEKIMLASELGRIKLSLRRSDDDLEDEASGATIADLDQGVGGTSQTTVVAKEEPTGITNYLQEITTPKESVPAPVSQVWQMHIHTPQDIMVYNWDDRDALPRELVEPSSKADTSSPPSIEVWSDSASKADVSDDSTTAEVESTDDSFDTNFEDVPE
ncbi:MAG: Flp pilus assembly protein CpaB [Pirellulaceae bacterium]|nr:Flp pilus assembly protein CpaB [Pirellulaceae bacterium]